MKKILFVLMLMLAGCGKEGQSQNLNDFTPIVNQFVSDATAHGRSVDISHLVITTQDMPTTVGPSTTVDVNGTTETVGTEETEAGQCDLTSGSPTITISTTAWTTWGPESKEALLYHELGHCLLFRLHNPNLDANGNPVSIMYPYTMSGATYQANRAAYLNELFNP